MKITIGGTEFFWHPDVAANCGSCGCWRPAFEEENGGGIWIQNEEEPGKDFKPGRNICSDCLESELMAEKSF